MFFVNYDLLNLIKVNHVSNFSLSYTRNLIYVKMPRGSFDFTQFLSNQGLFFVFFYFLFIYFAYTMWVLVITLTDTTLSELNMSVVFVTS